MVEQKDKTAWAPGTVDPNSSFPSDFFYIKDKGNYLSFLVLHCMQLNLI